MDDDIMRMLVTGGYGFIGSNFIRYITQKYPEIELINVDKLTYAGNKDNLQDISCLTFRQDICDAQFISQIMKDVDYIVHFAAETHVDRSIVNDTDFIQTNVVGTHTLLKCVLNANIRKFIHVSTDEVYGSVSEGYSKETDILNPSSPYSASKASSDLLVQAYNTTYGLPTIVTRCTNNFGPYQYPEKLIPFFITRLLENKEVPIYGTGTNIREWIHVLDHCSAIDFLIHYGKNGEIYNIGSGDRKTNIEITHKLLELLGKDESLIKYVPDRLGHDYRYALDCTKIQKLGWKSSISFDGALCDTVNWYVNNEGWWKH